MEEGIIAYNMLLKRSWHLKLNGVHECHADLSMNEDRKWMCEWMKTIWRNDEWNARACPRFVMLSVHGRENVYQLAGF